MSGTVPGAGTGASSPARLAAVVLTGGTGARMGGVDKAALELGGVSLLERALSATRCAAEVIVVGQRVGERVGERVATSRPVTWTVEDPPGGGPAAGLLAALDRFAVCPDLVAVLAVDMPRVTEATLARLVGALTGSAAGNPADDPTDDPTDNPAGGLAADGALLVDADGRRQTLAAVYRFSALQAARPADRDQEHGLAMRRLVGALRLLEVPAVGDEARDVDTWTDVADLRE